MNRTTTPLFRTARLLLAAAMVLATAGCLQPGCGFWIPLFGAANCSVADDNVQFSSNAGYTIQGSTTDTITLDSGWVYVTPAKANVGPDSAAVFVQTTYIVAGSDSPTDSTGMPWHPQSHKVSVTNAAATNGSYLVMAFTSNGSIDSTTVALVSGSMLTPSLNTGCQLTYYSPGDSMSAPVPMSQTVQDTLTIALSVQFTVAETCS